MTSTSMRRRLQPLLLAPLLGASLLTTHAEPLDQPMIGQPAPSFRLRSVDGKTLSLEEMRGRFIVLHFGASW